MAKLSKMEISAIANKIVDDVTTANQKYNDELREKEFKVWIVKYQKTKDYKVLKQYFDLQEDLYKTAHENFLKETNPIMKSIYKNMMKTYADNINLLLKESPQFMSVISGILSGEKNSQEFLASINRSLWLALLL